ncbi:helix-turn-helix domain-containing protein [Roseibacillus ishigakijimensis]|uniref:Helix-turn-helix transcriptional regulator n=1 Tax=Roseibacillus ishigakijimensis TaxID=454146 RepID=A0A934RQH6_9BACT|nr:helix-turn-helix transcriptional regulator [Roseibacillus ishigakijimensis]MBK1832671.1 helix-turn-helix transcriptional regulator [Roseibacillus ishigakijimensis]
MEKEDRQNRQQAVATVVGRHRQHLQLSQDKLAERFGLSQTRISDLGLCRNRPTLETLYRLARTFAVDIVTLVPEIESAREATSEQADPPGSAE